MKYDINYKIDKNNYKLKLKLANTSFRLDMIHFSSETVHWLRRKITRTLAGSLPWQRGYVSLVLHIFNGILKEIGNYKF